MEKEFDAYSFLKENDLLRYLPEKDRRELMLTELHGIIPLEAIKRGDKFVCSCCDSEVINPEGDIWTRCPTCGGRVKWDLFNDKIAVSYFKEWLDLHNYFSHMEKSFHSEREYRIYLDDVDRFNNIGKKLFENGYKSEVRSNRHYLINPQKIDIAISEYIMGIGWDNPSII